MFSEGLVALLAADPGVSSALNVSTRADKTNGIFPSIAPDEVTLPYVVYMQVHREPVLSFAGVNRLAELRFQLSCYGPSYKATKLLAEAVKNVLDGFQGTLNDPPNGSIPGNSYVHQTIPESEHMEVEQVFKGTVYAIILDYKFMTNGV